MNNQIGIDLGTTNTVCCVIKNGNYDYIKFNGKDLLPSTLLYKDKNITIGEKARKKSIIYSENYIKSSKTYMGDYIKKWKIEDKEFSPTDVATEVLKEIKKESDKYFSNAEQTEAVITVPAYFTSNQIDETRKAGENAGFKVKRILTEPIAAAIAYGFEESKNQRLFVFDLGGGTFDVSILEIEDSKYKSLAIDGDNKLGGDDFDEVILEMFLSRIRKEKGINLDTFEKSGLSKDDYYSAKQKLLLEAEKCKIELSSLENAEIELPNLFTHDGTNYNFSMNISRKDFENESKTLFNKIKKIVTRIFDDNGFDVNSIDKIVLVGGSSYISMVQNFIKDLFKKEPYSDKDLSKLVAMGAVLVCDENENSIDVRDIISHSLGIEEMGGEFKKILLKNDNYPLKKSKIFTTTIDYQKEVSINVFEGEDEKDVDNNDFYGSFVLDNIEKAIAGKPKIEVTFEFDTNRILNVTAKDLNTGSSKTQAVKIDKGSKKIKSKKYPYTKYLGLNAIVGVEKDVFGNAKGSNYDLAKDNAFEGVTIAILHLYTGEGFDFELPKNALKKKGFNFIHWKNTPPSPKEFSEKLKTTNQLWIISSNVNCISSEHIKIINNYFNEGKGVYIWGDNDPFYYDANLILNELFNSSMLGNTDGGKVVGIQKHTNDVGLIPNHLITTGIENVYEGITIATIYANKDFQPLIYGSDKQIVASFYDKDGKRAIIDGGFTRLFCNWNTAGTARYVVNAAAWLANYERFGDTIFEEGK